MLNQSLFVTMNTDPHSVRLLDLHLSTDALAKILDNVIEAILYFHIPSEIAARLYADHELLRRSGQCGYKHNIDPSDPGVAGLLKAITHAQEKIAVSQWAVSVSRETREALLKATERGVKVTIVDDLPCQRAS